MSHRGSIYYFGADHLSFHYFHDGEITDSYPYEEYDKGIFLEIAWEASKPMKQIARLHIPAPLVRLERSIRKLFL